MCQSVSMSRLMVVEELDPTKNLDEQLLKQTNGGGFGNRGRLCGLQITKEYPWISKLIMCCNSGNVPHATLHSSSR